MNASMLVNASKFQQQYARAKKYFPRDNERMILMRIASKYYSSMDEVRKIVDFLKSVDSSTSFDKVDLYPKKKEYMKSLDDEVANTKKEKEKKTTEHRKQSATYNSYVNDYNTAVIEEENHKTTKWWLWMMLALGGLMLFSSIGGLAGIGSFLANLTLQNTIGLAVGGFGALTAKRMYDNKVRPNKLKEQAERKQKIAELKKAIPEEKKKRDDLQTEKTNAENSYNAAVRKQAAEEGVIAGFVEGSLVQELADQAIGEIVRLTNEFLATAPAGDAHKSAKSWQKRYIQMIGKWVDQGAVSASQDFDKIVEHFKNELDQVQIDSSHESGKTNSVNPSIDLGGRTIAKPDSATIESSF